jgi:hypothetical protein
MDVKIQIRFDHQFVNPITLLDEKLQPAVTLITARLLAFTQYCKYHNELKKNIKYMIVSF